MSSAKVITRVEAVVTCLAGLVAAIALVEQVQFIATPMVDDAATSLAYARTFFTGHGLRLTPYSQPVEGFSNPLWVFIDGLALPFSDPLEVVQILGTALGVLGALVASAWGPVSNRRAPRVEDALPLALAASVSSFAMWIGSGLETGVQALAMSLAGLAVLSAKPRPIAGVFLGLLALTRPEAAMYAGLAGLVWAARWVRDWRLPKRSELAAIGWAISIAGGYELFRLAYYASWVPNTFYAKATWDFDRAAYLRSFHEAYPELGWPIATLGLMGLVWPTTRSRAWLSLSFTAAGVYFVWVAHGDWMREWRFLAPLVPFVGAAAASGLSALRDFSARFKHPIAAAVAAGLTSVGSVALVVDTREVSVPRSHDLKQSPEFAATYVMNYAEGLKKWLTPMGVRHPEIGTPDLGGNSFGYRDAEVVDTAGLADYAMARDSLRAREDYLLNEGPPDMVNAHGPSDQVRTYRRLLALYEMRDGDFRLRGLSADRDPRCPGSKAEVLALDSSSGAARIDSELAADRPAIALRFWRCLYRYRDDDQLPGTDWRADAAARALARGKVLEDSQPELALRFYSFATILGRGDAWDRKRTEALRVRLFP